MMTSKQDTDRTEADSGKLAQATTAQPAINKEERIKINMTLSCRDSDSIPKFQDSELTAKKNTSRSWEIARLPRELERLFNWKAKKKFCQMGMAKLMIESNDSDRVNTFVSGKPPEQVANSAFPQVHCS